MASSPPTSNDYNLKILRSLALYVQDTYGQMAIDSVARSARLLPEDFDGRNRWVDRFQFENVLETARAKMASDAEFKKSCSYRMPDAYGAIRFVLRAATPGAVFRQSVDQMKLVCSLGTYEVVSQTRTSMHMRWSAAPPPSRLVCLSRQAQAEALPTLWGLPAAVLEEEGCLANGDPYCGYKVVWYDKPSWLPGAIGAILSGGASMVLMRYGLAEPMLPALAAIAGGLVGHLREVLLTNAVNQTTDKQLRDALSTTVTESMQAQEELLHLHARQREWTSMLEAESRDRAFSLEKLNDQFQQLEKSRTQIFRGYSHDLRNPLQVMRLATGYLKAGKGIGDEQYNKVLEELEWSVQQMNTLLSEFNNIISQPTTQLVFTPQEIQVPDLGERWRRRLRALAHGRDLKTTVFVTREAPSRISIDPTLLDRIADNLFTNAAKYTERGSIIVELDGSPGFLVVKVSDTGRGIADEDMEKTFLPGGSNAERRADHSLGVGLSVVVSLLAQIGGRLEVMSKPNKGTTFWLRLPVEQSSVKHEPQSEAALIGKVISIRKSRE